MPDAESAPDRAVPTWVRRVGLTSWYFLGLCGAVTVVVLGLAAARDITVPLILALFLAAVFFPAVDWLHERGLPRSPAAGLVLVGVLGVAVGVVLIVALSLGSQRQEITDSVDDSVAELKSALEDIDVDPDVVDDFRARLDESSGSAVGGLGSAIVDVLDSAWALIAGLVLGVVILYYLLKDWHVLVDRLADSSPRGDPEANRNSAADAASTVQAYFRGRTALAAVQAVAIGVSTAVMGVPLPFAIGTVNFVGAYVPYLGAFIGGAFAVLLALSSGGVGVAVAVLVVVLVVNLVIENLLEPRFVGSELDMHPLAVLLVTILGGLLGGMVGLVLAAPLTAIARSSYRELAAAGFFDEPDRTATE
ncbi:MAG: AI-2E family transporter [Actinomycetota bacterium]